MSAYFFEITSYTEFKQTEKNDKKDCVRTKDGDDKFDILNRQRSVIGQANRPTVVCWFGKLYEVEHRMCMGWLQICEAEPCGMQTRPVVCTDPLGNCDLASIPPVERRCSNATCGSWNTGQWSMVSTSN